MFVYLDVKRKKKKKSKKTKKETMGKRYYGPKKMPIPFQYMLLNLTGRKSTYVK